VIVTLDQTWRGKSISELAGDGARKVQERMQQEQSLAAQVNRLNLQGVSAINRNSLYDARHYFERAYKLSPDNAFVLNNRGYLAEMDGDSETAEVFYQKARRSSDANARVGYATRQGAEGRKLFEVAETNDQKMQERMTQVRDLRRRATGPVRLKRRDNTPVTHTEPPQAAPAPQNPNLGPPQPPVLELNRTPRP
jgi:tetratricopeptide (TPR) repeat protein